MQFLNKQTYRTRIVIFSSAILTISAFLLSAITGWLLYTTAFEEEQERLMEIAQTQARLIEAVARFDAKHSAEDVVGGASVATLSQIIDAHKHYEGFGETGEFTLARREGDKIVFILSHRHFNRESPYILDSEEIMNEIITLIHCFSMKHYSKRRVQRAIEVLNEESTENQN